MVLQQRRECAFCDPGKKHNLFLICCFKQANTFVLGRVVIFLAVGLSTCLPVSSEGAESGGHMTSPC